MKQILSWILLVGILTLVLHQPTFATLSFQSPHTCAITGYLGVQASLQSLSQLPPAEKALCLEQEYPEHWKSSSSSVATEHLQVNLTVCMDAGCTASGAESVTGGSFKVEMQTDGSKRALEFDLLRWRIVSRVSVRPVQGSANISMALFNGYYWQPLQENGNELLFEISNTVTPSTLSRSFSARYMRISLSSDFLCSHSNAIVIDVYLPQVTESTNVTSLAHYPGYEGCKMADTYGISYSGLPWHMPVNHVCECIGRCALLPDMVKALLTSRLQCFCVSGSVAMTTATDSSACFRDTPLNFPITPLQVFPAVSSLINVFTVKLPTIAAVYRPVVVELSSDVVDHCQLTTKINFGDGSYEERCQNVIPTSYKISGTYNINGTMRNARGESKAFSGQIVVTDNVTDARLICPEAAETDTPLTCYIEVGEGGCAMMTLSSTQVSGAENFSVPYVPRYEVGEYLDPDSCGTAVDSHLGTTANKVFLINPGVEVDSYLSVVSFCLATPGRINIQIFRPKSRLYTKPSGNITNLLELNCTSQYLVLEEGSCKCPCSSGVFGEPITITEYMVMHDVIFSKNFSSGFHEIGLTNSSLVTIKEGDVIALYMGSSYGGFAVKGQSSSATGQAYSTSSAHLIGDVVNLASYAMTQIMSRLAVKFVLAPIRRYVRELSFSSPMTATVTLTLDKVVRLANIQIQLPVTNASVSSPAYAIVGQPVQFQLSAGGTAVVVQAYWGEGASVTVGTGVQMKTFSSPGYYKLTLYFMNRISGQLVVCNNLPAIYGIEGMQLSPCSTDSENQGFTPGSEIAVGVTFTSGDYMNVLLSMGDGSTNHSVTNVTVIGNLLAIARNHTYERDGVVTLYAFASNPVGNETKTCTLHVEFPIEGLSILEVVPYCRTDRNLTIGVGIQKGSAPVYNATFTDQTVGVEFVTQNGSNAVVMIPAELLTVGSKPLNVCVTNRVTEQQCVDMTTTAVDPVIDVRITTTPENVVATGEELTIRAKAAAGSHMTCFLQLEGFSGAVSKCVDCPKGGCVTMNVTIDGPGLYNMKANCTNPLTWNATELNITAQVKVKELRLTCNDPQQMPGNITCNVSSAAAEQPTHAICELNYGDGSEVTIVNPCSVPYSFNIAFRTNGIYTVIVKVRNDVSQNETSKVVIAQSPLTYINVTMTRDPSDPMYRRNRRGGGHGYSRYPTTYGFVIEVDWVGDADDLVWNFGDGTINRTNNNVTKLWHNCSNPGTYQFSLTITNMVSTINETMTYICNESVSCSLHEDSPWLTNNQAIFTVFMTNVDEYSAVRVDYGRNELEILGGVTIIGQFTEPYRNYRLEDGPNNISHVFAKEAAQWMTLTCYNSVSMYNTPPSQVFILNKPCRKPLCDIDNAGDSPDTSHIREIRKADSFILKTINKVDCSASKATLFMWSLAKLEEPPLKNSHVNWTAPKLVFPPRILTTGIYKATFAISMIHAITGNVSCEKERYFKIVPSQLSCKIYGGDKRIDGNQGIGIVDGSQSSDPDVDDGDYNDMTFEWYCWRVNASVRSSSTALDPQPHEGPPIGAMPGQRCFGNEPGKLPYNCTRFSYNASTVTETTSFVFFLVVSKDKRTATCKQERRISNADGVPSLTINSEDNICPTAKLSFVGGCHDYKLSELNVNWRIKEIELENKTMTETTSMNLVLLPDTLKPGREYQVLLSATKKGDLNAGETLLNIKTNNPPRNGVCVVSPSEGFTLNTVYIIRCTGWHDPDDLFSAPDFTVSMIREQSDQLLKYGTQSAMEVMLPLPDKGDQAVLKILIKDKYGCANVTFLKVTVRVPDKPDEVLDEMLSDDGPIRSAILEGDTETATSMLSSVVTLAKHMSANGNSKSSQQILHDVLRTLPSLPVVSVIDMMQVASVIALATDDSEPMPANVQNISVNVLHDCVNLFLEQSGDYDRDTVNQFAEVILQAIGNVIKSLIDQCDIETTNATQTQTSQDPEALDYAVFVLKKALNAVIQALLDLQVDDEGYTRITTKNLNVTCGKVTLHNLSNKTTEAGESKVRFPSNISVLYDFIPEDAVASIILFSLPNMHVTAAGADALAGGTFTVEISHGDSRNPIQARGLREPMEIELQPDSGRPPWKEEQRSVLAHQSNLHNVTVEQNDSSLHARFILANCSGILRVYYRRGQRPTEDIYDRVWDLPRKLANPLVDNYTVFLSNTEMNRTASLDRHLFEVVFLPNEGAALSARCNYTMIAFGSSCLFLNETLNEWKRTGCVVLERTTYHQVICQCDHLTTFAGGFFVAPNPIDFKTVFAGFRNISDNPAVLSVVVSVIGVYLILVIWARRMDIKDAEKVGVTILPDNDPRDNYAYEVTVYTGFQRDAYTTANVFIQLIGSIGDSDSQQLKDPKRPKFLRGAIDQFLFTVPQSLGILQEVHLWHDNSGPSPSWFLFKVQVRDMQTEQRWWFVCNKWLAIDENDGKVERKLKVANKNELTNFNILFVNATRRNLLDGHLWLSVITRPPKSTFTRVQRLTCCLALLLTTMLANAMFYQTGDTTDPRDITLTIGPFRMSWSTIVIGFQSSLVVIPVSLLIVTIFRRLAPNDVKTSTKYEVDTKISKQAHVNEGYFGSSASLAESASEEAEHTDVKDISQDDNEKKKKKFTLRGCLTFFSNKEEPEDAKHKAKFLFPHWCLYLNYLLCFAVCGVASFFSISYGIMFGKQKSEEWISSMLVSFSQSVVVIQPFKVLLLAAFFALVIKDPKEEDDADEKIDGMFDKDEDDDIDDKVLQKKSFLRHRPPDVEKLEELRALRLKQREMRGIIREIVMHFLVVVIVLFVAYSNHDNQGYTFSQEAIRRLTNRYPGVPPYQRILNIEHYWMWASRTLVNALYPVDAHIGYPYMGIMRNRYHSNVIGLGRLRQVRIKSGTCTTAMVFSALIPECNDEYTWADEDMKSYKPGWISKGNETTKQKSEPRTSWDYRDVWELNGFPYWGTVASYRGGGFVLDLGPTNVTLYNSLMELIVNKWIDPHTRGVFTEVNIYNVNLNLLCVVTLLFEFLPTTGGLPFINVQPIKLFRYTDGFTKAVLGFEIIFLFLMFYWIYRDMRRIFSQGKSYWKSVWNLVDSTMTSLSICCFGLYFARWIFVTKAVRRFREDRNRFVSFQYVVLLNEVLNCLIAVVVMLLNLKFLRLLRFNRKISMLSETMRVSSKSIGGFIFMIMLVLIAFSFLTTLVFGQNFGEYRTVIRSLVTLCSMMLNKFNYDNLEVGHRVLGPIFFFVFVFSLQFILLNVFVGILGAAFSEVRSDALKQPNEYEIVTFMTNRLKNFLGQLVDPPVKPKYRFPKTEFERKCDQIEDDADTVLYHMRNICAEDVRSSNWLIPDQNMDKKMKLIALALESDELELESDLFDALPVINKVIGKYNSKELDDLVRKTTLSRPSTWYITEDEEKETTSIQCSAASVIDDYEGNDDEGSDDVADDDDDSVTEDEHLGRLEEEELGVDFDAERMEKILYGKANRKRIVSSAPVVSSEPVSRNQRYRKPTPDPYESQRGAQCKREINKEPVAISSPLKLEGRPNSKFEKEENETIFLREPNANLPPLKQISKQELYREEKEGEEEEVYDDDHIHIDSSASNNFNMKPNSSDEQENSLRPPSSLHQGIRSASGQSLYVEMLRMIDSVTGHRPSSSMSEDEDPKCEDTNRDK